MATPRLKIEANNPFRTNNTALRCCYPLQDPPSPLIESDVWIVRLACPFQPQVSGSSLEGCTGLKVLQWRKFCWGVFPCTSEGNRLGQWHHNPVQLFLQWSLVCILGCIKIAAWSISVAAYPLTGLLLMQHSLNEVFGMKSKKALRCLNPRQWFTAA